VDPILRVSNLRKSFGSLVAVDDVSLEVLEGSIFGIAGPNGAGKTSLFNAITGLPFHADAGTIEFGGRRVERTAAHELCRLGIARTFQQVVAFNTLSVDQNVRLAAVFGRARGSVPAADVVDHALRFAGLTEQRNLMAGSLPLDARKRLMLASALATEPRLLMLDEPAAGLHGPELARLHELILAIREMGITVVMIEHVLPVLFGLSDRVLVMDAGRSIAEGTPTEVAMDEVVISAYLGEHGRRAFDAARG
jgi:branched-chain amino acid transport system ATP-binding protein